MNVASIDPRMGSVIVAEELENLKAFIQKAEDAVKKED